MYAILEVSPSTINVLNQVWSKCYFMQKSTSMPGQEIQAWCYVFIQLILAYCIIINVVVPYVIPRYSLQHTIWNMSKAFCVISTSLITIKHGYKLRKCTKLKFPCPSLCIFVIYCDLINLEPWLENCMQNYVEEVFCPQ